MLKCVGPLDKRLIKLLTRSLVIDYVQGKSLGASEAMVYFYFDYHGQDQQTPNAFLRSILRQLVTHMSEMPQLFLDFHERFRGDPMQSSTADLLTLFKNLCTTFDRVYVVLDALDECHIDHRKHVLHILGSIDLTIMRVFVTSRSHSHDIRQHFAGIEPIQVQASEADLSTYCHRIMEQSETTRELVDASLKDEVAATISRSAQGM